MVEINYKCTNCDFKFTDKDLIFYLNPLNNNKNNNKKKLGSKELSIEEILDPNLNNLKLFEESLTKENSDKMNKSLISGFLYENYCPHCNELIKTYVPENNTLFTEEEIEEILLNEINKNETTKNEITKNKIINSEEKEEKLKKLIRIIFFDFKNTFYKDRRNILENNTCPNCNKKMSLVISEKILCPKCGNEIIEEY